MEYSNKTTIAAAAFIAICCAFIKPHEGTIYHAAQDTGGIWSICNGHTEGVKKGDTATQAQCDQYLHSDTIRAIAQVNMLTDNAPMPDAVKKVFVDEVFNAGAGNFAHSTMLRKIRAGDLKGACSEFPRWRFAGGKDCAIRSNGCYGIVTRRAHQMDECLKGLQ